MEIIQTGPTGLSVMQSVAVELSSEIVHVLTHQLQTEGNHVQGLLKKHGCVVLKCAQLQVTSSYIYRTFA